MTTSYSPELNYQAGKPKFNGNPDTLFEGGAVPQGWQTMTAEDATQPADNGGLATGVSIVDPSMLLPAGGEALATTTLTGAGSGATVDLIITAGMAQLASINVTPGTPADNSDPLNPVPEVPPVVNGGSGYEQGDRISVDGYPGLVLVVTGTSD